MGLGRKYAALLVLTVWLFLVVGAMILNQYLSGEIFFVLWLIGTLVIVELATPAFSRPEYQSYLRYAVAVGVILFGYIVALKVLEILGE
ncbi:hypothetical protein FGU65_10650 [Methanoculleus sp. FWC-SCC1]|uniref:Uncharacterized protein n=1 Tax=Methanoculleus frigidifontis TaxID=2584085 RepID=A0ABT8MBN0_9EURY|nr:hypothetical protein [Methanoculleus sp. FWC-SCC1]MDN7025346.1 hypothetical protein [Methanoculleus sp. FWC-SCC1]